MNSCLGPPPSRTPPFALFCVSPILCFPSRHAAHRRLAHRPGTRRQRHWRRGRRLAGRLSDAQSLVGRINFGRTHWRQGCERTGRRAESECDADRRESGGQSCGRRGRRGDCGRVARESHHDAGFSKVLRRKKHTAADKHTQQNTPGVMWPCHGCSSFVFHQEKSNSNPIRVLYQRYLVAPAFLIKASTSFNLSP